MTDTSNTAPASDASEPAELSQSALARRLLRSVDAGVLSTQSLELPGYPFGSVTPYALTVEGEIVIQISEIAQHTRNIDADPKVSLTVVESGAGNRQALGRVTVVADATRVPDDQREAAGERYFAFFPEARGYAQTHSFHFYWLKPRRVRFIGGFGKIFWVEPEDWLVSSPAWRDSEAGILEHMNTDHADALVRIARQHAVEGDESPRLLAVDTEGTHLSAGGPIGYVPFAAPAVDSDAMRSAMIQLARSAS